MKRHFYFDSSDKKTKIHGIEWKPQGQPIAVLQLVHGMVEYIDRYDTLATYLTAHGICVIGHDHLGHGESVQDQNHYGFIHEKYGNRCLIQDIHRLRQMIDQKYEGIPHFILGHSMGSFLVRQYIMYYAQGLAGAIIMGTGYQPAPLAIFGKELCSCLASIRGWHHRSKFVDFLGIGNYNLRFLKEGKKKGWVTSHTEEHQAYLSDPLCNFTFTLSGYYALMETLHEITHIEYLQGIPMKMPILVISGSQDPVGAFEKGVRKVYHQYREAGLRNLRLKFYPQARHELLHEYCQKESMEFILNWINSWR